MPPDAQQAASLLSGFLTSVERRVQLGDAARALTVAAAVAACGVIAAAVNGHRTGLVWTVIGVSAAAAAMVTAWRGRPHWSGAAVAALIERRLPDSQNVIFTARELLDGSHQAAPWIQRRVLDAAAALVSRASVPAMVPLGRPFGWMALALAVLLALTLGVPQHLATAARRAISTSTNRGAAATAAGVRVAVTVTPPGYTKLPERRLVDPAVLEVVKGSRLSIALTGTGVWSIRFGTQLLPAVPAEGGSRAELAPDESGYFAIERRGAENERRLLPVTVTPDRAPAVRIEAPGKDLLLPAARGTVPLTVTASDDFGLQAVELKYTKVSGSGEQFQFVEGTLPLALAAASGKAWKASGSFELAGLGLEPGDSLVYHAVARDTRPDGSGLAASDTFFVEVAGPGQVAVPGFELPPDRERYALSEQMIVLKLTRLRARQATLSEDALAEEVKTIEAEQRAVRSNFIFLMGGHVEDEEEEAAQSNEIQEGRLENSARREINTAIKFMGQTEQALAANDTAAALPPARSAVKALQRAFGHNRYFMKTLAVRSRVDPSRRLSGDLKEASDWRRTLEQASSDPQITRARAILARLFEVLPEHGSPAVPTAAVVGELAEEALAVDPGSSEWQRVSLALTHLREAIAGQRTADVTRLSNEAVAPLVALASKGAVRVGDTSEAERTLRSAWADEARK